MLVDVSDAHAGVEEQGLFGATMRYEIVSFRN